MERVQVLIDRLIAQKQRNENAAQLLVTVQLLHQELLQQQQQNGVAPSKKVAVVMPAPAIRFTQEAETIADAAPGVVEAPVQTVPEVSEVAKSEPKMAEVPMPQSVQQAEPPKPVEISKPAEPVKEPVTPFQSYSLRRPSITELLQEKGEQREATPAPQPTPAPAVQAPPPPVTPASAPAPAPPTPQPHFDVVEETPTLLQHTPVEEKKIHKEVNQIIHGQQRSLNDQLKQQTTEVAHLLQETPIKDLRKAIGINDKFVFLNELFNGDEAMYERSVKTINNFHVLQEAEYWINRELKLRLGWNDTKDAVQHFYQLVRRRFS